MEARTLAYIASKQSGIAVHAASWVSQLSAEMLEAPDDDNDPFLLQTTKKTNEITVEDTDWLRPTTHFLGQEICFAERKHGIHLWSVAFQIASLNEIVLTLV